MGQKSINNNEVMGFKGNISFTVILPIEVATELNIEKTELLQFRVHKDEIVIKKWIENSNKTGNNNNGEVYDY
jgi:hypothetical protein